MLDEFVGADAIHPILILPDKQPLPYEPAWSRSPGCYQLKSAMAWHDLYELTGEPRFRADYEKALGTALDTESGFLPGSPDLSRVMDRLHAYCYFLEALLPRLDDAVCRESLGRGIEKVSLLLREIRPAFERADVAAQLLRLRLYAAHAGVADLNRRQAAEESAWCESYFAPTGEPRIAGGFWFGRKEGSLLPFVNPASSAFCIQALDMWQLYQEGRFAGDRYELI
jgi:hypothetical protein